MEKLFCIILAMIPLVGLFQPAHSQIQTTGCSSAMLTSFTPCMNFVTNSTGNGVTPTAGCCNSLKSLVSNGTDCMCLIATGNVPFQIPINRTMAVSLPKACNMPGVPLQCKAAAAAPVPAPGPATFSPALSPTASPAAAEPSPATSAQAPVADSTPDLTPPSSTGTTGTPTTDTSATPATGTTGSRPVLTPSAAGISHQFSPLVSFAMLAFIIVKFY